VANEPTHAGIRASLAAWLEAWANIGCRPEDSEEDRLRKRTLVLASSTVALLAIVWVVLYAALGLLGPASIPLAYQIAAIVSIAAFARRRAFGPFRFTILALMLVLPFVLQWSLGGFVNSSAVSLWSLMTALSALFFYGPRQAIRWFVAFLALLAVSGLLDPLVSAGAPAVPAPVRLGFFVLNVGCVAVTLYLLVLYFVLGREREAARSEALLRNVLPGPIVERLKRSSTRIADGYAEASVLFADVVDFTPYAERTPPGEVVGLLDDVFSRFDALTARHGLEKIKTVGDAYMVVGGVPEPRPDHIAAVAEMALDILAEIEALRIGGQRLQVRVGIATGPVVAGVIGRRKFAFDLWGDTVNTAARMESQGVPGRIQVTPAVEAALRDRYRFLPRGGLMVKGKGEMATFFLVGRREAPLDVASAC
jgi:adenylate cyclase